MISPNTLILRRVRFPQYVYYSVSIQRHNLYCLYFCLYHVAGGTCTPHHNVYWTWALLLSYSHKWIILIIDKHAGFTFAAWQRYGGCQLRTLPCLSYRNLPMEAPLSTSNYPMFGHGHEPFQPIVNFLSLNRKVELSHRQPNVIPPVGIAPTTVGLKGRYVTITPRRDTVLFLRTENRSMPKPGRDPGTLF